MRVTAMSYQWTGGDGDGAAFKWLISRDAEPVSGLKILGLDNPLSVHLV